MTLCGNCGAESPAGKRFCGDCGNPLVLVCSTCGAENPPGKGFCGDCGEALEAGPPSAAVTPASTSAPIAERRLVSVLFADLVGFTTLSESRDSEEVRDLLSKYFEQCRLLSSATGERSRSSSATRSWPSGAGPVAKEDDAERAVRAALDLVQAVAELGAEIGAPGTQGAGRGAHRRGCGHARWCRGGRRLRATWSTPPLASSRSRSPGRCSSASRRSGQPRRQSPTRTRSSRELKGKAESLALFRALRVMAGHRAPSGRRSWRRRSSDATASCASSRSSSTGRRMRGRRSSCR